MQYPLKIVELIDPWVLSLGPHDISHCDRQCCGRNFRQIRFLNSGCEHKAQRLQALSRELRIHKVNTRPKK